jgi:hypothetical protein
VFAGHTYVWLFLFSHRVISHIYSKLLG